MNPHLTLLVAEDDENDIFLLTHALGVAQVKNPIHFVRDGQEAVDFLRERCTANNDQLPVLILLDLKMPQKTGLEVLEWLREQPVLKGLPTFIFSSSTRQADIEQAYALGASGFLVKPASTHVRKELMEFLKGWLTHNQPPIACTRGYREARTELDALRPKPSADGPN